MAIDCEVDEMEFYCAKVVEEIEPLFSVRYLATDDLRYTMLLKEAKSAPTVQQVAMRIVEIFMAKGV